MSKPGGGRIIIVKKVKKGHAAHHGGSWKVAYADFVTAMMAFFMVMWILGMDENMRQAIEGYFSNPVGYKKGYSGGASPLSSGSSPASVKQQTIMLTTKTYQERRFTAVSEGLRSALDSVARVGGLKARVEIVLTAAGLRIELIEDESGDTFFPFGSAEIKPAGRMALKLVAQELRSLENPLVVEGHTDAAPYMRRDYTNWELSADRANAARRILERQGVPRSRIVEVNGLADRHLKFPEAPLSPSNRRISIVLPFVAPPSLPELPASMPRTGTATSSSG